MPLLFAISWAKCLIASNRKIYYTGATTDNGPKQLECGCEKLKLQLRNASEKIADSKCETYEVKAKKNLQTKRTEKIN